MKQLFYLYKIGEWFFLFFYTVFLNIKNWKNIKIITFFEYQLELDYLYSISFRQSLTSKRLIISILHVVFLPNPPISIEEHQTDLIQFQEPKKWLLDLSNKWIFSRTRNRNQKLNFQYNKTEPKPQFNYRSLTQCLTERIEQFRKSLFSGRGWSILIILGLPSLFLSRKIRDLELLYTTNNEELR